MKIFGLELSIARVAKTLQNVAGAGGPWSSLVRESYAGAWQQNVVLSPAATLTYSAVFACITLIASDLAKLRVKLMSLIPGTFVWQEISNPAYSPVLRKPNDYQTRVQFWESYYISKLRSGNTYVLKQRDLRGVVVALYVLDPLLVQPLVADDGSVFYQLSMDRLSGVNESIVIPAREIIHDRWNCMFHPLVGISPLYASALAATQGMNIQNNSSWFFANKSMPGAILTAPGNIPPETAERLKIAWDQNYSGANAGKVAVLGDGLKFDKIPINADEMQMIEQLKWTGETVASTFHVPPYKIGVGQIPANSNVQALNVEYYSQCLQVLIESTEVCLDEGLGMSYDIGTEVDVDNLLRMDSVTLTQSLKDAVGAGIMTPDEARAKMDLPPTPGGNTPYLQQQNYSLAALAKRDASDDPFGNKKPATPPPDPNAPPPPDPNAPTKMIEALRDIFADVRLAAPVVPLAIEHHQERADAGVTADDEDDDGTIDWDVARSVMAAGLAGDAMGSLLE